MERKSYELVAWTVSDGVRMLPSLAETCASPYLERIRKLEAMDEWVSPVNEINWLLEISEEYERLANFYLRIGNRIEALHALEQAAVICGCGSDILWLDTDYGFFPTLPLFYRFLSMHSRALNLVKRWPELQCLYESSELKKDYLLYTSYDRHYEEELNESLETIRAWNFKP